MKAVEIGNGEKAILGESQLITKGLDMNCYPIVTKAMLVEKGGEVVCKSGGCLIKIDQNDFTDYMLDTPANRKTLRASFKTN